jgi:hypothetical protein
MSLVADLERVGLNWPAATSAVAGARLLLAARSGQRRAARAAPSVSKIRAQSLCLHHRLSPRSGVLGVGNPPTMRCLGRRTGIQSGRPQAPLARVLWLPLDLLIPRSPEFQISWNGPLYLRGPAALAVPSCRLRQPEGITSYEMQTGRIGCIASMRPAALSQNAAKNSEGCAPKTLTGQCVSEENSEASG